MDTTTKRRDPEAVQRALAVWLTPRLEGGRLEGLTAQVPEGHGFSNDTFMVEAVVDGAPLHFVVQAAPTTEGLFPEYQIARMARIQQDLRDHSDVPVANVRWQDDDVAAMGAPFYVMDRLHGRVPDESPVVYHAGGWMSELDAAEQGRLWRSLLEAMAALHRVEVAEHFSYLTDTRWGMALDADPAAERVRQWREYTLWACDDDEPPATLMAAWDQLAASLPPRPPSLSIGWGDAKLGNVMFDDAGVVALLDWELVGVGPAEEDLMNLLAVDAVLAGVFKVERLPGLLTRHETVAAYATLMGRELVGTDWWYAFALAKMAAEMHRMLRQRQKLGSMPAGVDLEAANIALTPLLRELATLSAADPAPTRRSRA